MISLDRETLTPMIAEARLAPSVHNVQPARWRLDQGQLMLLGNRSCTLPVADPNDRDWRLSIGAHLEGMSLAAATRGLVLKHTLDINPTSISRAGNGDTLVDLATVQLHATSSRDQAPALQPVETRASWRGSFQQDDGDKGSIEQLRLELSDCTVVADRNAIRRIAQLTDRAALHFLRDKDHRRELLHWLRLSRKHPRFDLDGLNLDAMNMSDFEGWGAGLVLGPFFQALDRVGLAAPLLNEAAKTVTAAAVILFHRPSGEDAFLSGRKFYRAWLALERAGLAGCPMSVLVDWSETRTALAADYAIPDGQEIVSVMRVGKPAGRRSIAHARLAVEELLG